MKYEWVVYERTVHPYNYTWVMFERTDRAYNYAWLCMKGQIVHKIIHGLSMKGMKG